MMTPDSPADVQSRISVFEALATSSTNVKAMKSVPNLLDKQSSPSSKGYFSVIPSPPSTSTNFSSRSPSTSPPNALGRKTSLIDLKDWVVEDGPLPYAPRQKKVPGPNLTGIGEGHLQRHVSDPVSVHGHLQTTPLIHLDSSPPSTVRAAPPLPPRKASYSSLKSVSVSNSSSSSLSYNGPSYPPLPLTTRKKSDSPTVDSAYTPTSKLGISIPSRGANGSGHVPASSISSFHSVSLSSDGGTDGTAPGSIANFVTTYPVDREDHDTDSTRDIDTGSLDESFENVSVSSMISPSASSVSHDWADYIRRPTEPPKLPQRPLPSSSSTSPSGPAPTVSVPYTVRASTKGPPPPPPPRKRIPSSNRSSFASTTASSSDHSSVFSAGTSRSSLSSGRPVYPPKGIISNVQQPQFTRTPPVPLAARRRYDNVFNKNVMAQRAAAKEKERAMSPPFGRKARQAAGWRGLSVDLITNPEMAPTPPGPAAEEIEVTSEDRLDGRIVAKIWKMSKVEKTKLQSIWKECNMAGRGSLDREAFSKGMWRIDEELRKAQTSARSKTAVRPPKSLASILR
ncbi:hypothetical protein BDY19DRAFT_910186 [Irpex rosettiformis]|uniref:Uncharacterized protein n=1 Tax=Irpex rosettiformis TaxID=378272 RepID=A0ACB8TPT1_9APHY|nr:hypothetical protein BDY19DRAFT_910186 [Irpex rosettiformis]